MEFRHIHHGIHGQVHMDHGINDYYIYSVLTILSKDKFTLSWNRTPSHNTPIPHDHPKQQSTCHTARTLMTHGDTRRPSSLTTHNHLQNDARVPHHQPPAHTPGRRQVRTTAMRLCPAQVRRQRDPPSLLSDTHQVRCGNQTMNDNIHHCSSSSFTTTNHTTLPPCNDTMNGHEEQPPPPTTNGPPPHFTNITTTHEHNVNAQEQTRPLKTTQERGSHLHLCMFIFAHVHSFSLAGSHICSWGCVFVHAHSHLFVGGRIHS